jgi:hypothetical protein
MVRDGHAGVLVSGEWVGARLPAPVFVEENGGYLPDVVVWLDVSNDHLLGMRLVEPGDDAALVACLEEGIARAGRPRRIRGARRPPRRAGE